MNIAKISDGEVAGQQRDEDTFNANGGSGVMNAVEVNKDSNYKLPACEFTAPAGKEFDKWLVSVGTAAAMTKKIGAIVKEELAKKELKLYDIKFEFGRVGEDAHIALIDEISGGNMRAYKNGEYVEPLTLEKMMLS